MVRIKFPQYRSSGTIDRFEKARLQSCRNGLLEDRASAPERDAFPRITRSVFRNAE
jgi:hypothetical protein